jgi:hypothetical protein
MPECSGIALTNIILIAFYSFSCYVLKFAAICLRSIVHSTSFTKKVDLVLKMVSNMGHHLKKKSGMILIARILTTLLRGIFQ